MFSFEEPKGKIDQGESNGFSNTYHKTSTFQVDVIEIKIMRIDTRNMIFSITIKSWHLAKHINKQHNM